MLKNKYYQIVGFIRGYPWLNYWGPVCTVTLFIFITSSIPEPPTAKITIPYFDKVMHGIVYGFLGYFSRRALAQSNRNLFSRYAGFFAIVFCLLYGVFDEIHQSYVPPRETDPFDLMADVIGATIGQLIQQVKYKSQCQNPNVKSISNAKSQNPSSK
ncbi:MAG: VanZ family protein [bacterium]|nr:VanZ family protein [bacterium]